MKRWKLPLGLAFLSLAFVALLAVVSYLQPGARSNRLVSPTSSQTLGTSQSRGSQGLISGTAPTLNPTDSNKECCTAAAPAPFPPDVGLPGNMALASVDAALANLPIANIAFNTPAALPIDETADIQLVLDLKKSSDQLRQMISAAGKIETDRIQVAPRMTARLTASSSDFSVVSNTPETQAISANKPTAWSWTIHPNRSGTHSLHLDVDADIIVDGVSTPRSFRTFDKNIDVTVTIPWRVEEFARQNWQWLWTALLVPLAGWWWKRRTKNSDSAPI